MELQFQNSPLDYLRTLTRQKQSTEQTQELPPPPPVRFEPPKTMTAGSFLKQLIPKGLDTGDLLIIVLLLLMAGDCEEEKNNALLTLALYLFL